MQPEKLSAVDFIPLDTYSSFEVVRKGAMRKHAELKAHTKDHGLVLTYFLTYLFDNLSAALTIVLIISSVEKHQKMNPSS